MGGPEKHYDIICCAAVRLHCSAVTDETVISEFSAGSGRNTHPAIAIDRK